MLYGNSPRHQNRWFEANANFQAAGYFDMYHGSGATGYVAGSPAYFDRNSFVNNYYSPYINPRNGLNNYWGHSIISKFHWTDLMIYIPVLGLIPAIFY